MIRYALVAFDSTHQALAAEPILAAIGGRVCPVLREISASCGMAIRLDMSKADTACDMLSRRGVTAWAMYEIAQSGYAIISSNVYRRAD